MAIAMDYRVGSLEKAMAEMAREVARTSQEVAQTSREMREASVRSERETRAFQVQMNKKWGELSNKLGTMAEDLEHIPNQLMA